MNWFLLVAQLLPYAAKVIDEVHHDVADHHKQLILSHILVGAANGANAVAPKYAATEATAAAVGQVVGDAVTAVVSDAKAGNVALAITDGAGAAVTGLAAVAAVAASLPVVEGPGLHVINKE